MIDVTKDDWQEARERDGDAKEELPQAVREAFEESEEVGLNRGLPLIGDSYDDYPTLDDVVLPESRSFVESLISHEKVHSIEDAVQEVSGGTSADRWREALQNAIDAFGIDTDGELGGFDVPEVDRTTEGIDGFTTTFPDDLPNPETHPLIVSHFYLLGLSVSMISEHLQSETGASVVSERDVWQTLVDCGLVRGTTSETRQRRESGITVNPGAAEMATEGPRRKRDETGRHPITNIEL